MKKLLLVFLLGLMVFSLPAWSADTPQNFEVKAEYYPSVFQSASDGNFNINNAIRAEASYRFDKWRVYLNGGGGKGSAHNIDLELQEMVFGLNRMLQGDVNFNLGFKWFGVKSSTVSQTSSDVFRGLGFGFNYDPQKMPLFLELNYYPSLNGSQFHLSDLEYNLGLKSRGKLEYSAGYRGQNFVSSPGAVTSWRGIYFNLGTRF